MDRTFDIQLRYNEVEQVAPSSEKMSFYDALYVEVQKEKLKQGLRIQVTIHPKEDIVVNELNIQLPYDFLATDRLFCNGYQSQSESLEYLPSEQIAPLRSFAGSDWKRRGDYENVLLKNTDVKLYSWTYGYVRRDKTYFLLGSLTEKTGFTLIQYHCEKKMIHIKLDAQNLNLAHSFPALDIVLLEGPEQTVFDPYFQLMEIAPNPTAPLHCVLSTPLPFSDTLFSIRNKDDGSMTNPFTENKIPIDLVLVNEGYSIAPMDWMDGATAFPKGISVAPAAIRNAGYKSGIHLAPFVCSTSSSVFKNKKEYLLKDQNGNPISIKDHQSTDGLFYVLDFYNKSVTDHLISLFHSITKQWSFDVISLDLLHVVCALPPAHKTAGQVMCEAMDFLRQQTAGKQLIASAVPLGAAFGRVDYCATSQTIIDNWENKWQKWNHIRERSAAVPALRTQLHRRQLNGRAFLQAPVKVLLSEQQKTFTVNQQQTYLLVSNLLQAGLLLPPDSSHYSPEQFSELIQHLNDHEIKLEQILEITPFSYQLTLHQEGQKCLAYINLYSKKSRFQHQKTAFELEAYESIILAK